MLFGSASMCFGTALSVLVPCHKGLGLLLFAGDTSQVLWEREGFAGSDFGLFCELGGSAVGLCRALFGNSLDPFSGPVGTAFARFGRRLHRLLCCACIGSDKFVRRPLPEAEGG